MTATPAKTPEINLHTTFDARVWAAEFQKTAKALGYSEMDEAWLVGWFANAIMAGYDRATGYREVAHAMLADGITPPGWNSSTNKDAS